MLCYTVYLNILINRLIMKRFFALLILIPFFSACTHPDGTPMTSQDIFTKENIGAAAGAIGGAWVGSNVGKGKGNIAAIAVGTLLGGYLGKSVGASLDKADQAYHGKTYQYALEKNKSGTSSSWQNPDSGHSGSVTPINTFERNQQHCREFSQTVTIGGNVEEAYGIACRQPDGTWKIQ
jgi:surface antigen